jgi:hypothetical protein
LLPPDELPELLEEEELLLELELDDEELLLDELEDELELLDELDEELLLDDELELLEVPLCSCTTALLLVTVPAELLTTTV